MTEKMLRRHPHVFGEISVRDAAEVVVVNWEIIKKQEKSHAGHGVLDGVPKGSARADAGIQAASQGGEGGL